MFGFGQKLSKNFNFCWSFFQQKFLFCAIIRLFPETQIIIQCVESEQKKFSDNLGHNILELYNILEKCPFTTSKALLHI